MRKAKSRNRPRAATGPFKFGSTPQPGKATCTFRPQINNGDEARYASFIANFSQGLPHNGIGEVDTTAYQALLTAVASGKPDDFAKIPLGGTVKLAGPQGGLAFDLEGTDSCELSIPPSPALASSESR